MDNRTLEMERATLALLTEEFYVVEEYDTLREALGYGLDDAQITYLLEWRTAA